jgi:tetratricopeptide (TPR) repeat protein
VAAVFLLVVTVAVVRLRRRCPYQAVGWLWWLGALVPVIGLVQVGGQAMADRYAYVPNIGLYLAAVWGGADLLARLRVPAAVRVGLAAAVLAALVVATRAQARTWRDSLSLWGHAVAVDPSNPSAHHRLSGAYLLAEDPFRAEASLLRAVELGYDPPQLHGDLAEARLRQEMARDGPPRPERIEEIQKLLRYALEYQPDSKEMHTSMGVTYYYQRDLAEAERHFKEALRIDPQFGRAHFNLALVYNEQGYPDLARHHSEAARLDPAIRRRQEVGP